MNDSLGKIINIEGNMVTLKIDYANILSLGNLMNIHVVFTDGKNKLVGEIIKVDLEYLKIAIVGELAGETFIPGISLKPSFNATTRIINKNELVYILGTQEAGENTIALGFSSIYQGYRINVDVN